MPQPSHERVEAAIDAVEAEMRKLGWWDLPEPPRNFDKAFGMDVMAFPQWLRYVFIPRVRGIIAERGEYPRSSSVGTQAMREFDGDWDANDLVSLLNDFDAVINHGFHD